MLTIGCGFAIDCILLQKYNRPNAISRYFCQKVRTEIGWCLLGIAVSRKREPLGKNMLRILTNLRFSPVVGQKKEQIKSKDLICSYGAAGRGRTDTVSLPRDFESRASANSTTPAYQNFVSLAFFITIW